MTTKNPSISCLVATVLSLAAMHFVAAISAAAPGGVNSNSITIADNANASIYPSNINVTDVGTIQSMAVTLRGVTHPNLAHLTVLLVSPSGTKVQLMANAPGSSAGADIRFLETGQPFVGDSIVEHQVFRPTVLPATVQMPAPAPGLPYATSFLAFSGESFNGVWSLYIRDNTPGGSGVVSEGWAIGFGVGASIPFNADFTYQGYVTENSQPLNGVRDVRLTYFTSPSDDFGPVSPVGSSTTSGVSIVDGRFAAVFTPPLVAFSEELQLWAEVSVADAGSSSFTVLSPRQRMSAVPFATLARRAVTADTATTVASVNWGQITGVPPQIANPFLPWQTVGGTNLTNVNTGNVLIGIGSGNSRLTVNGVVESLSGGVKFPDGTVQVTAGAPSSVVASGVFGVNLSAIGAGGVAAIGVGTGGASLEATDLVVVQPQIDLPNGLMIQYARVNSGSQIRVVFFNASGASIDAPLTQFNYRVIR